VGHSSAAQPRGVSLAGVRLAGFLGAGLLRLLGLTWRVRAIGRQGELALRGAGRPILYAFWHGELLPLAYLMRGMDATVMVSEHRDGEYITQVIRHLGFRTVRGSTTRGGFRSLIALARLGRAGELIAITPDGPRGPRRKAQIGALLVAQRAGVPIIPVAASVSRARRLASWDEFVIPAPFARAVLAFGPTLHVPPELKPAELAEQVLPHLEASMNATCAAADVAVIDWARTRLGAAAGALMVLYDLAWSLGLLIGSPYVALRSLIHPGEMAERFGLRGLSARPAAGGGLWLHCSSLGETRGALPLLRRLAARGESPLVTTVTPTARAQAADMRAAGAGDVLHAPLDFRPVAARVLARVAPRALLIFETEIWPGLLSCALARGVPVAFVNARLTERGVRRWSRARPLARDLLARVRVAAQSPADAERWRALGAAEESISVTGNTKYEQPCGALEPARRAEARGGWRTVLVFGSVRSAEAEAVADALGACRAVPGPALFVLVPRHRESAARIVAAAARVVGPAIVRSTRGEPLLPAVPPALGASGQALLHVDTVGELRQFYAVADAAFIGATLCPIGGHNPFEAAEQGVPVVHGPHTANVADVVAALAAEGGGFRVADGGELGARLCALASSQDERQAAAQGALRAAAALGGAVERTLAALESWGFPLGPASRARL
jgi:3-deoxy-D-manno-octulosonic-acid transferase